MSTASAGTPGARRTMLRNASRLQIALLAASAALLLLLVIVATTLIVQRGEALPGTSVGGQDVGGLGRADIVAVSEQLAAERAPKVLQVAAGDSETTVTASDVGLTFDAEESADEALVAGRDGFFSGIWNGVTSWFGAEREIEPTALLDAEALDAEVVRIQSEVDREPRRGGFRVTTDGAAAEAQTRDPRAGQELDAEASHDLLRDALIAGADQVELPVEVSDPGVTQAQAEAVTVQANAALAAPLVLSDDEGRRITLTPSVLAPLLGSARDPGTGLRLTVSADDATTAVQTLVAPLESDPRSASLSSPKPKELLTAKGDTSFKPRKISTSASGGSDGLAVDVAATVEALTTAVLDGTHSAELVTEVLPAPVSSTDLSKVDQVIGSFTTSYSCCAPRARNIERMAEIVDGTVVAPGATFSLNQAAGERTKSRGFYSDGAIVNGELVQQVGGGVSQFSTTLFNAVWFSGLPSLEHRPHSSYISRYPPGREATLNWGTIDNVFRNDTDHPVVVRTSTTPTSVTVALYGHVGNRVVESTTGPRERRGNGGFRVVVDRTVTDDGDVVSEDRLTWTYGPPL